MAIFSGKKTTPNTPLAQLKEGKVSSPVEQQRLIREVLSTESIRPKDVGWALASKRPELRKMAVQIFKRGGGEMAKAMVAEFKDKSEGEQKNWELRIMLRSASPSAAAPKFGMGLPGSVFWPSLLRPMSFTSSTA